MTDSAKTPKAEPIPNEPIEPPPKKPSSSTSDEKSEYLVLEPILHDGQNYNPEDKISLTEKQAQLLLALEVIKK